MSRIQSPDDPHLAMFIGMRDRDLRRETGLCLAEGEHLVRRAFEAGLRVRAVLVVEQKADRVEAMLAESAAREVEVLSCTKAVFEDAVGFKLHQGIVATVEPPAAWDGLAGLRRAAEQGEKQGRSAMLVCPEITNAENLGLLARVAAGLGTAAMVLGPRCADPWYRRAVRVSMGAVFRLPMVRLNTPDADLAAGLNTLREAHGYTLIATVTDPAATPLDRVPPRREPQARDPRGQRGLRPCPRDHRPMRPTGAYPDARGGRFIERRRRRRDRALSLRPSARRLSPRRPGTNCS